VTVPFDAVPAVSSAPVAPAMSATMAPGVVPRPGAFAEVLNAQQQAPEDLPTLTFGEMTGLSPTLPAPVLSTAATVPAPAAPATSSQMAWPVQGRISSEFGPRVHPVTGARRDHHGLDIAAPTGTPISAAAGGKVTFAGQQRGYGNIVIVDHGNGTETRYAHQDTIAVSVGQRISAGQRVGTVGSTGLSTGPHLHFEVRRNGEAVDPRGFLS
jgi:murein DD-endopeptidase MepM/ murein hydrolase activator NlpD